VDDVARQGAGRGGEIQHALGVDERILLVAIHDDRVGEAQEVRLGDGDGKDPAALDHIEVAREGVRRVLLGPDESEAVLAVLGDVGAGSDARAEARVFGLEDLLQAGIQLERGLGIGDAGLVARMGQAEPQGAEHAVQGEGARADARDVDAEALLVRLGVARRDDHLDDGEGRDEGRVHREDPRAGPALLLLVHVIVEDDADGLARHDARHLVVGAIAARQPVLGEGVDDDRLAHALHGHVVLGPLAHLKELLGVVVARRLGPRLVARRGLLPVLRG